MTLARKKRLQSRTPMKRAALKAKSRPRAKAAEREHMGIVAGLCCIVCRNLGFEGSPAEVHHVRFLAGGGQRAAHMNTIPLCPLHHRTGGYGVAFHAGPAEFQRRYGTEAELLEQTRRETAHTIFASVAPEVA
ncbi:Ref family recombination enhancement nuclease [Pandoraea sputorum]|uniref:Ref family recombination enhancement nuclease n=1 Tax=Pandoraea sputorum TaxID=93222 RepID=UPI001255CD01|nr:Ref family recombination enhancement nuclease [Pandoraea sputorum]VVE78154.1 hypothetical protein PSP31120_01534 [Pandoraea sputorum]